MREGRCSRVSGAAIAKIPESVGDGSSGTVGEGNRQGSNTNGRVARETCDRHNRANADHRVGKIAGARWSEANDQVSGCKPSQVERRAGQDREWPGRDAGNAIA